MHITLSAFAIGSLLFTTTARAGSHGGPVEQPPKNPVVVVEAESENVDAEARRDARKKILKIFEEHDLVDRSNGTWGSVRGSVVTDLKKEIANYLTADGEKLLGTMKLRPEQTPFEKNRWVVSSETSENGIVSVRQKYWITVDPKNGTITKEGIAESQAFAYTPPDEDVLDKARNLEKIWNSLGANRLEAAKNWDDDNRWTRKGEDGKTHYTAAYQLLRDAVKAESGLTDFRIKVVTIPGEKNIVIRCVDGDGSILKELKIQPRGR